MAAFDVQNVKALWETKQGLSGQNDHKYIFPKDKAYEESAVFINKSVPVLLDIQYFAAQSQQRRNV